MITFLDLEDPSSKSWLPGIRSCFGFCVLHRGRYKM